MSIKNKNNQDTIAKELFTPDLSDEYMLRYSNILKALKKSLSINRISILKEEMSIASQTIKDDDIDGLKYLAVLSVLIDLSSQGWVFDIESSNLTLRMENDCIDDKEKIRYRLSAERNAQFKDESVNSFIKKMEKPHYYNGVEVSIKNLIGDPIILIDAIKNHKKICDPYIQLVTEGEDSFTGLKLSEIWRYFRYTWSIPYKTMPGRNMFYLVRDRLQAYHPVVGIFALGNSVLNLTVRDDEIGWTVSAIKSNMMQKTEVSFCDQKISDSGDGSIKVKVIRNVETYDEFLLRSNNYADRIFPLLQKSISDAISEIYVRDLGYFRQTKYPTAEKVKELIALSEEYGKKSINNRINEKSPIWEDEAQSNLFKRKRASELAKLLSTKIIFNSAVGSTNAEKLNDLLSTENGRKAIHTALICNRKCKIGSNMMEIIVCGAIPPYNELLGGKLISILSCSPTVIRDYTYKYKNQISEIASRMKGKRVIRDSQLVFLGTTSLYSVGSSQYNRIKVPFANGAVIEYKNLGVTEGFGTVFFSKETTSLFSKILEIQDGGKRINHVFGEGTSPRFRMISKGLNTLGIKAEAFLKHYSPRIVYSINLAKNTNEFLMGFDNNPDYGFDISSPADVKEKTQELVDFWYHRWLEKRLTTIDIVERLNSFDVNNILIGNICGGE